MGWASRANRENPDSWVRIAATAEVRAIGEILSEKGLTAEAVYEIADNAGGWAAECVAPLFKKAACRQGCSWCCALAVTANAFDIVRAAREIEGLPHRDEVRARVLVAAAREEQDEERRFDAGEWCPLLEVGRCAIYEARPANCIACNAEDLKPCEAFARFRTEGRQVPVGLETGVVNLRINEAVARISDAALLLLTFKRAVALRQRPANDDLVPDDKIRAKAVSRLRFLPALAAVLTEGVEHFVTRWLRGGDVFAAYRLTGSMPSTFKGGTAALDG